MAQNADAFTANVRPIIVTIKAGGRASLRTMADELNVRRVETARSSAWSAMQVRRIMERA